MAKRKAPVAESGGRKKRPAIGVNTGLTGKHGLAAEEDEEVLDRNLSPTSITIRWLISRSLGSFLESGLEVKQDNDVQEKGEGHDNNFGGSSYQLEKIRLESSLENLIVEEAVEGAVERILILTGTPISISNAIKRIVEADNARMVLQVTEEHKESQLGSDHVRSTRGKKKSSQDKNEQAVYQTEVLSSTSTTVKLLISHLLLVLINRTKFKLPSSEPPVTKISLSNANDDSTIVTSPIPIYNLSTTFIPFSSEKTFTITSHDVNKLATGVLTVTKVIQSVYDSFTSDVVEEALSSCIPYQPQSLIGSYGHPDTFRRQSVNELLASYNPYINPSSAGSTSSITDSVSVELEPVVALPTGPASMRNSSDRDGYRDRDRERGRGRERDERDLYYTDTGPRANSRSGSAGDIISQTSNPDKVILGSSSTNADGTISQQVHIPNDVIGSVIGKSGLRINEIRQTSGCMIKIGDAPAARSADRLVTVTGKPSANKIALEMIHKFIESDRWR